MKSKIESAISDTGYFMEEINNLRSEIIHDRMNDKSEIERKLNLMDERLNTIFKMLSDNKDIEDTQEDEDSPLKKAFTVVPYSA